MPIGDLDNWLEHPVYPLLFDPQTSGGLLASVAENEVDSCLQDLHQAGYQQACVIGQVQAGSGESEVREMVFLQ